MPHVARTSAREFRLAPRPRPCPLGSSSNGRCLDTSFAAPRAVAATGAAREDWDRHGAGGVAEDRGHEWGRPCGHESRSRELLVFRHLPLSLW